MVYIREAHPDSVVFARKEGREVLETIRQTNTLEHRFGNAEVCLATLQLTIPAVVDRADDAVNIAYAGWPDRMIIVGADGRLAYIGGPGPSGFKPNEVEQWLKENLPRRGGPAATR